MKLYSRAKFYELQHFRRQKKPLLKLFLGIADTPKKKKRNRTKTVNSVLLLGKLQKEKVHVFMRRQRRGGGVEEREKENLGRRGF